jgi:hypothetical protein
MPHLDGAHSHGSGFDWRMVAAVAVIVVVAAGGGASGAISGLVELLYWVAGVVGLAVIAGSYLMIRATRHARGQDYVKSVHGPTEHDLAIEQARAMKREVSMVREIRREIEKERLRQLIFADDDRYHDRDYGVTWPYLSERDEKWTAEVLNPGHEVT